jgi:hypothetical protein
MKPKIEFDITVDGITPQDFVNWLINNYNLGPFNTIETDRKYIIHMKHIEPNEEQSFNSIDILLEDASDEEGRSKGTYDPEIQSEIEGFQKEYPEIDINSQEWAMIPIGRVIIFPIGRGIEARCESDGEYSVELKQVSDRIMSIYGGRVHNTFDGER